MKDYKMGNTSISFNMEGLSLRREDFVNGKCEPGNVELAKSADGITQSHLFSELPVCQSNFSCKQPEEAIQRSNNWECNPN